MICRSVVDAIEAYTDEVVAAAPPPSALPAEQASRLRALLGPHLHGEQPQLVGGGRSRPSRGEVA